MYSAPDDPIPTFDPHIGTLLGSTDAAQIIPLLMDDLSSHAVRAEVHASYIYDRKDADAFRPLGSEPNRSYRGSDKEDFVVIALFRVPAYGHSTARSVLETISEASSRAKLEAAKEAAEADLVSAQAALEAAEAKIAALSDSA